MYKLQPMLQRDSSIGNSPFASKKFSPYSNYKEHIRRSQSLGGKGCSTVRSNGKTLERFHAEQNLNSFGNRNSYFGEKQRQNGRRSPENEFVKSIDPFGQDKNSRYKTEICRNFKERSNCIYGDQCQFAHGRQELRDAIRNNKYKTKSCQKYWVTGYCAYGPRCNFLHYESGEPYDSESPSKLDSNQPMIEIEQHKLKPSLFNSERENKSPSSSKSEEELAETVEEVISAGRGILDKMEKDKIDPSLEDLFMKLKRALPAKRSSPPIVELTSKFNESNKVDMSGASPMTIERNNGKKVENGFYSSNLNNRSSTASNNSVAIHDARPLTNNTFEATESPDYPKYSTGDIFNWIDKTADKVHDGRNK